METKNNKCLITKIFEQIWNINTISVLKEIRSWKKYFSTIKNQLKWTSSRTLSTKLKQLEKEWFINRNVINEIPNRIEYTLTEKWEFFWLEFEKIMNKWEKKKSPQ